MAKPFPALNSTSSADIAFILLIFFLVATTMDTDKGIARRLPPMPDKDQQLQDVKVNRRNIVVVRINSQDRILAGGEPMDITQVKDKIVEFITNPTNSESLPEKEMKDIQGFGQYPVSKGVVSLQNDRGTSYAAYLKVQNELVRAFNEIRDNFAMANWSKKYSELDEEQQRIVRDAIPQSISEAEPKEVKKRR
ncbi:MAG: biopolymer transporter ExbD [Bacteroidales bacterium]|nr:biopolymer transporter ExbD [Bacteroidales bacterium]MBR6540678.1 biopolymer transporter ExbD [Bacteroidales bacterium]